MSTAARPNHVSVPVADPLTLFLANHRRALPASRGDKRFNSGEHIWLGSVGAERARERLANDLGPALEKAALFSEIRRRDGTETLQYGELVALSGDFYETPEALFDETPSPLPWLWEANDLSDLQAIFAKELQWIDERLAKKAADKPYPSENIRLAWNAKSYVELALRNTDHFGWHNVCAYRRHHAAALELAISANRRNCEVFRQALYTNAFADHFLTDGFAAGHIRVPRAEIRDWASERGLSEKVAGALSKLLHDQDGHVDVHSLHGAPGEDRRDSHDGLQVEDSLGDEWHTYCDGQLFLEGSANAPAVANAVNAVADSVSELLLAWQRREVPSGVYAATKRVPFPHRDAPALIRKFPADMPEADLDALWQSVAWYAKVPWIAGLERRHLVDLFAALPEIMSRFRAHVTAAADDPGVTARIAPGYVAAYKAIA